MKTIALTSVLASVLLWHATGFAHDAQLQREVIDVCYEYKDFDQTKIRRISNSHVYYNLAYYEVETVLYIVSDEWGGPIKKFEKKVRRPNVEKFTLNLSQGNEANLAEDIEAYLDSRLVFRCRN